MTLSGKTITFFVAFALSISSISPMGYKVPDRRQQQQQAQDAAQHLQHMEQETSRRFMRRHRCRHAMLSARQASMLTLLTILVLLPMITAHTIDQELSSGVYRVTDENVNWHCKQLGMRKRLSDGLESCYSFHKDLLVARCAYKPPRCVYFDLGGVIGGKVEFDNFNVTEAYAEELREHDLLPHTHYIADEASSLTQMQNINGTQCTIKLHEPEGVPYWAELDDFRTKIIDISNYPSTHPALQALVKECSQQVGIPLYQLPRIFVYWCQAPACVAAATLSAETDNGLKVHGLLFTEEALTRWSDDRLKGIIGHEISHYVHRIAGFDNAGIDDEIVANIYSTILYENTYFAIFYGKTIGWNRPLPILNKESILLRIKLSHDANMTYPDTEIEVATMLLMHEFDEEAGELLRLTADEQDL